MSSFILPSLTYFVLPMFSIMFLSWFECYLMIETSRIFTFSKFVVLQQLLENLLEVRIYFWRVFYTLSMDSMGFQYFSMSTAHFVFFCLFLSFSSSSKECFDYNNWNMYFIDIYCCLFFLYISNSLNKTPRTQMRVIRNLKETLKKVLKYTGLRSKKKRRSHAHRNLRSFLNRNSQVSNEHENMLGGERLLLTGEREREREREKSEFATILKLYLP